MSTFIERFAVASAKRVLPVRMLYGLRLWARENLPNWLQNRLKKAEQLPEHPQDDRNFLLERQDAMFSIMEQRLEMLEASLFKTLESIEQRCEASDHRLQTNMQRVEDLVELVHQSAMVQRGATVPRAKPCLSESAYRRLQSAHHNPEGRRERHEELLKHSIPSGVRLLDIGCGDGAFLERARTAGCQVSGVDSNSQMVRAARERGLDVELADALEHLASLPSDTFDIITCLHVVEHLGNDQLAGLMAEAHRVLRAGGTLIIETPKVGSLYTLTQYYFVDPTHQPPRSHDLYEVLLRECGFGEVEVSDVTDPWHERRLRLDGSEKALRKMRAKQRAVAAVNGNGAESGNGHYETPAVKQDNGDWRGVVADLHFNLKLLEEWLFVAQDVRLVARKCSK